MALDHAPLLNRLDTCVDRVGGKRALAQQSGISEAQIYRYLNGETIVPSDRLVAIAEAAGVDSSWLLNGDGSMEKNLRDPRPGFAPALLQDVVREFESLLLEYEVKYSPEQRAHAIAVLYEAARLNVSNPITRQHMLHCLDFLGHEQRPETLRMAQEAMSRFEYGMVPEENPLEEQDWLNRFDALMCQASARVMNAYTGELYFARMSGHLPEHHVRRLLDLVVEARNLNRLHSTETLNWLDVSCGNGREIAFLHAHTQPLAVRGLTISDRAATLCNHLMFSGKLPQGTVMQADTRNLPLPDASQHVVYARMGLSHLPLVRGSGIGLEAFMDEALRVMKPGGMLYIMALAGDGRDYLPFRQRLNHDALHALARDHGLRIVRCADVHLGKSPSGAAYDNLIECVMQK